MIETVPATVCDTTNIYATGLEAAKERRDE